MPTPVRSMTGFASLAGHTADQIGFTISLKSVNHRYLDLRFYLPAGSEALEATLRARVKARVARGHVELALSLERQQGSPLRLNSSALNAYLAAFTEASQEHGLSGNPDLNLLLRLPGVITTETPASAHPPLLETAVLERLSALLDRFEASRETEGAALAGALRASLTKIDALASEIAALRETVRPALAERLRHRMAEALAGTGAVVSDERLLSEAAMLAERSDIEEELVRLRAHLVRFAALLDAGGEVGKRLDFLLQEFGRESNTILSKTGGASGPDNLRLTDLALEVKAEIERMREQVQNLE